MKENLEEQWKKQAEDLEVLDPKKKSEINRNNIWEKLKQIFSGNIYTGKISINEAKTDQTNLLDNIADFSKKSKPRSKEDMVKIRIFLIA